MKKAHKGKSRHKQARRPKAAAAPARSGVGHHRTRPSAHSPAPSFVIHFERLGALLPAIPAWRGGMPRALADVYRPDEREALALLLLPFLLLAFAIGLSQSLRPGHRAGDYIAAPPAPAGTTAQHRIRLPAAVPAHTQEPSRIDLAAVTVAAEPTLPVRVAAAPAAPAPFVAAPLTTSRTAAEPAEIVGAATSAATPATPPLASVAAVGPPTTTPGPLAAPAPTTFATPAAPPLELASLEPATAALPDTVTALIPPVVTPDLSARALPERQVSPGTDICSLDERPRLSVLGLGDASLSQNPAEFGRRLAEAARHQHDELVVYNDRYRQISYPLGDVSAQFGVCTDVVIRAYRAVGIDLQMLVHETRSGSGDASIDHRRVETLRRFFAKRGTALPVTDFAEDYRPGDIVTYYRPQNRHSRSHIAIVSDMIGPSGRPMIVHNRAWGVQIEDGLFVDQITGHYRFAAEPNVSEAARIAAAARDKKTARQPAVIACSRSLARRGAPACQAAAPDREHARQASNASLPHAQ